MSKTALLWPKKFEKSAQIQQEKFYRENFLKNPQKLFFYSPTSILPITTVTVILPYGHHHHHITSKSRRPRTKNVFFKIGHKKSEKKCFNFKEEKPAAAEECHRPRRRIGTN